MDTRFKAQIMDEAAVERALIRIAHQIVEKNPDTEKLLLAGIKTRGVPLAHRIAANIRNITGCSVPVGELDITMHRDDRAKASGAPVVSDTCLPCEDLSDKIVLLVDDVIYTCRTARAAMDAVISLGRPAKIQLFAMIDRGHAELPIKANFVGKNIPTANSEQVSVKLREIDGETSVSIWENVL